MTTIAKLGLVSHSAATSFGILHFLTVAERQSDKAVVFLHGYGHSSDTWLPVIEAAAYQGQLEDHDIIVFDLPGFGASENRLQHLRMPEVGAELVDVIHRLGYSQVRLVGHSMGGFLALDMAAQFPDVIISVHIACSAYFTLSDMVDHPFVTTLKAPAVALFYYAFMFLGGPQFRYGAENGRGYDADKVWAAIEQPVYGVFGARDRIIRLSDVRRLRRAVPQAKLTVISKGRHSLPTKFPDEVATALFGDLA